jgi:hypothetical protein
VVPVQVAEEIRDAVEKRKCSASCLIVENRKLIERKTPAVEETPREIPRRERVAGADGSPVGEVDPERYQ